MDAIIVPKEPKLEPKVCEYFVFEYKESRKRVMCISKEVIKPGILKAVSTKEHGEGEYGEYWENSMIHRPSNIICQGKAVWTGDHYLIGLAYLNPTYNPNIRLINVENPNAIV